MPFCFNRMALYIIYELIKMGGLYIWQQKQRRKLQQLQRQKKATVKKTREVYLQWYGKEVQLSSITARIEEMWKKEMKRKISELVDLKVYVKPEEGKAHYVINGEITGSIEL